MRIDYKLRNIILINRRKTEIQTLIMKVIEPYLFEWNDSLTRDLIANDLMKLFKEDVIDETKAIDINLGRMRFLSHSGKEIVINSFHQNLFPETF